jgi:hypothetical protein
MLAKFLFKTLSLIGFLLIVAVFTWIVVSAAEVWLHSKLVELGIEHSYNTINFFKLILGW